MSPLKRTWAPRGQTPTIRTSLDHNERVNLIGALCVTPGKRKIKLHLQSHEESVSGDQVIAFLHLLLRAIRGPIVLVWDNLNVHKAAGLREFAATRDWLTIYYLPPYAPDLNPVEGIWSLLRRGWLSNVAFSTPEHLVQTIRRGLRHIQYRSHLIDGCLTETGLTISP